MSRKKTGADWFNNQREYKFIAKIEQEFFTKLNSMKGYFDGVQNLSIYQALERATSFCRSPEDYPLDVVVSFDVTTGAKRFGIDQMHLGSQLRPSRQPEDCQVTHFIALTDGDNCKTKLHVDLDFDLNSSEPKPSPHIQIGGRLAFGKRSFKPSWDESIDKPRWPSLPCCTALLWHAAFQEFYDCESVKRFVEEQWWGNLVAAAEKALWGPFIVNMADAIRNNSSVIAALYPPRR